MVFWGPDETESNKVSTILAPYTGGMILDKEKPRQS